MPPSALCLLGPELLWATWEQGCSGLNTFQGHFEEQWLLFPVHRCFSASPPLLLSLTEHGAENLLQPCNQEAVSVLSSGGQEADHG